MNGVMVFRERLLAPEYSGSAEGAATPIRGIAGILGVVVWQVPKARKVTIVRGARIVGVEIGLSEHPWMARLQGAGSGAALDTPRSDS